jgi:hypothetical protein
VTLQVSETDMTDISILDKVLSSKQTTDIANFNPAETLAALFRHLSKKEEEVLQRRYGLDGGKRETLEEIGKRFHVTRERIRQIENSAKQKLKNIKEFRTLIAPAEDLIRQILESRGSATTEESLFAELFRTSGAHSTDEQIVDFLISELMNDTFDHVGEEDNLRPGWKLKAASLSIVRETIDHIVQTIEKNDKPITLESINEKIAAIQYFQEHPERRSEETILSYIELSPKISKNPYGEYGLVSWGTIVPKRMNDKIFLVLKKSGKPLHFNEITRKINEVGFDKRKAYPPTVHNELILNTQYVLVGRGIYALREWGYKPGVVADVLVEILKSSEQPMTRDELVNKVLEQRIVKKNTVYLALADRTKFDKFPDGRYALARQARE